MRYYKLTDEEQKILDEVEKGEWIPVKDQAKAKREALEAARKKERNHSSYLGKYKFLYAS